MNTDNLQGFNPDFVFWLKLASWSIEEAAMLMSYLDPDQGTYITGNPWRFPDQLRKMQRLLKVFSRADWSDEDKVGDKIRPIAFVERAMSNGFEIPGPLIEFKEQCDREQLERGEDSSQISGNPKAKVHGNTEHNARNREQILGAAVAVILEFPEQCRDGCGTITLAAVVRTIEDKAQLFWPETHGLPLEDSTAEKLLGEWRRKASK